MRHLSPFGNLLLELFNTYILMYRAPLYSTVVKFCNTVQLYMFTANTDVTCLTGKSHFTAKISASLMSDMN